MPLDGQAQNGAGKTKQIPSILGPVGCTTGEDGSLRVVVSPAATANKKPLSPSVPLTRTRNQLTLSASSSCHQLPIRPSERSLIERRHSSSFSSSPNHSHTHSHMNRVPTVANCCCRSKKHRSFQLLPELLPQLLPLASVLCRVDFLLDTAHLSIEV